MAHLGFQTTNYGATSTEFSSGVEAKISFDEAQALQVELSRRATTPVDDDPALSFDSSMSSAQVRARFMALVQRSREPAFA